MMQTGRRDIESNCSMPYNRYTGKNTKAVRDGRRPYDNEQVARPDAPMDPWQETRTAW